MRILARCLILAVMISAAAQAQQMLYLKGAAGGTPCKVLEETPEYVLVRIPSAVVERIEPSLPASPASLEEYVAPSPDEMLAVEDLGATRSLEAEIKEQVSEEMEAQRRQESGGAVGQILWNGEPLFGCRLRVTLLERRGFPGGVRKIDTGLETFTDEGGFYRFEHLEPGQYKLSWVPPSGEYWVRRLRLDPDFEVKLGETTQVEPLEVHVSTLN